MAAAAIVFSSLCSYSGVRGIRRAGAARNVSAAGQFGTAFSSTYRPVIQRSTKQANTFRHAKSVSIRCEQQSTNEGSGLDVWLGRFAMIGFAAALTIEIATGKGLLENFGLTSPLPTLALAATALVGVLTAVFIFQSASKTDQS